MCGIISRPVAATMWSVGLIGRFIFQLDGLYSLVVEFGQQLALWVALCVVIATIFFFSVEHFVPSAVVRVLPALSLCFCFFKLLAVAMSLLWRFSCSKCLPG